MKLTGLTIRRMPGFEDSGFELRDLNNGLNLIVGPNASGKTTTCRSIRGLLWPETLAGLAPVSLVGHWEEDSRTVRIELVGNRRVCQIDGLESELPQLPPPHLAQCFTITVTSLLEASRNDSELAETVMREMAGGYDLEAVLKSFTIAAGCGRKESKALSDAVYNVRQIQQEQQSLRDEETHLDDLETQRTESRRAQERLTRLEEVRQLLEARAKIAELRVQLDGLPKDMGRLNGGEDASLRQLLEDLEHEGEKRREAERNAEQYQTEKDEADLPEEGLSQSAIREQQTHLESLRDLEQRIESISTEIVDARSRIGEVMKRFGENCAPDKLDEIELPDLDSVEALHRDSEKLRNRRSAIEERLAVLGEEQSSDDTDTLVEAIRVLRQWFEVPAPPRPGISSDRKIAWGLAVILVSAGLMLGILVNPWVFLAAAAGAAGAMLLWRMPSPDIQDEHEICRERYQRLNLDQPETWDAEGIGKHLNVLEKRLAKARRLQEYQSERLSRRAELDKLAPESEEIHRRRTALVERLGVDPSVSDSFLVTFSHDLVSYRKARDTLICLERQLEEMRIRYDEQLSTINRYLVQFGEESASNYGIAKERSVSIGERAEQYRSAGTALANAHRELSSSRKRIEEFLERKHSFYDSLGLSDDDETGLKERLRLLPEYHEMQKELTRYLGREAAARERLSDAPDLQEMSRESLDDEVFRLQELAERHQGLLDSIAAIRAKVAHARRGNALQDALSELSAATDHLAQCREETLQTAAGRFLLGRVRDAQQSEHQPIVLRQAREWLTEFTRGRYDLRVGRRAGDRAEFSAYDNTQRRGQALNELSGGTRMQLLLAVRLAFAASAERGTQLPFVLDEALSGTDPIRFRAIVECLTILINQGRQVFYMTCQPGDANAWQEVSEQQGLNDVKSFDLASVRDLQKPRGELLAHSAAATEPVPAPEGRSLSEYVSVLGVPAFDPTQGSSGLHVAYLVDDPNHLHNLLSAGIRHYGQLKALVDQGHYEAYIPSQVASRAKARAVVIQAVCDCWKVGRGRSITREALQSAGVSDSFIDRIADLAQDLNWNASRVLDALEAKEDERTKGFRTTTLESVKEALISEGYIDTRPFLTEDEALSKVLSAADIYVREGHLELNETGLLFKHYWALAISI